MKTRKQIADIYQQIIDQSEKELRTVRQNIYYISLLRLVLFAIALVNLFLYGSDGWIKIAGWVILPFIVFVWLVKRHNVWFHRKDILQKKIEINQQELNGLQYDFSAFDGGKEYMDPAHFYTYDLDVFGEQSLFQSLNRTSTPVGKSHLAHWLNAHLVSKEEILLRQEAVRELTSELNFRQQIRLQGLLYEGKPADLNEIKSWAESASYFRRRRFLRYMPGLALAMNASCLIMAMLEVISFNSVGVVFLFFVLFSTIFSKSITKFQDMYGKKLTILSIYADQILLAEKQEWHSRALRTLHEQLTCHGQRASQSVRTLSQLMNTLDQRNNVLMSSILNGCFLWELRQVMRIEQWREQHAHELPVWIDTIGELEAYCSLATFAYNHPDYSYPTLSSKPFEMRGKAMGHPLMSAEKCVCNDIDIEKKPFFIIITGANMAGKSTYLRTVGTNYLLACIGAPVFASQLEFSPVQLITSLRTTDSLTDNESYFFAELKRLKRIIDLLQEGQELFIVLDEILKGTNSMDKQKGSLALIKQFIHKQTNGIIATHDLLLGSLIDSFPQSIQNYCFEADITNNELSFSYRMRKGVAQNMNACFLMKKMGIVGLEAY